MLILATLIKLALIAGILAGAGLVLARSSLSRVSATPGPSIDRIQCGGLVIAAASSAAAFTLLVWRLGGEFDFGIASIAALSPPGYAAGLVIAGSILALKWRNASVLGSILVVAATAVAGHAAAKSVESGVVVGVHVAAAAWWTGGLIFLFVATRRPEADALPEMLARFSRQAIAVILMLLAAGFWTLVELVGLTASALASPYGKLLLLKIALVAGALSIALFNRLTLAPAIRLDASTNAHRLRKSITVELTIIALIAVATAMLTTTGPQVADAHNLPLSGQATDRPAPDLLTSN